RTTNPDLARSLRRRRAWHAGRAVVASIMPAPPSRGRMNPSPYRTRPPEAPPPPRPTPSVTTEVVVPAAFVWLACLVRIGGVALGRAPLDRDLALAVALLV